jgi:hypothetical protein
MRSTVRGVSVGFYGALVFVVLWAIPLYRFFVWPRLRADSRGIVVRNAFSRFDLAWSQISYTTAPTVGPRALTIQTVEGKLIRVQAVVPLGASSGGTHNPGEVKAVAKALNKMRFANDSTLS